MTTVLLPAPARDHVARLLNDSAQGQRKVYDLTTQQTLVFDRLLQDSQARLLRTVDTCLIQTDHRAVMFAASAQPPLSPFLKPLPAPPVDEEVQALEIQVAAACQRVAELRATVPGQLAEHLSQHLQQCRPSDGAAAEQPAAADTSADAPDVGASRSQGGAAQPDAAVSSFQLKPAPAELQTIYSAAVQKMPALRAKLGETLERMDRVVQAIEQQAVQPSPYTAQLAHLQPVDTDAENVSPALQQALQTGQVTTRKGVAKEVNAVPFVI